MTFILITTDDDGYPISAMVKGHHLPRIGDAIRVPARDEPDELRAGKYRVFDVAHWVSFPSDVGTGVPQVLAEYVQ